MKLQQFPTDLFLEGTCMDTFTSFISFFFFFFPSLPYQGIFGGAGSFSRKHFEAINGFSNQFWGWGGEDDDLYSR